MNDPTGVDAAWQDLRVWLPRMSTDTFGQPLLTREDLKYLHSQYVGLVNAPHHDRQRLLNVLKLAVSLYDKSTIADQPMGACASGRPQPPSSPAVRPTPSTASGAAGAAALHRHRATGASASNGTVWLLPDEEVTAQPLTAQRPATSKEEAKAPVMTRAELHALIYSAADAVAFGGSVVDRAVKEENPHEVILDPRAPVRAVRRTQLPDDNSGLGSGEATRLLRDGPLEEMRQRTLWPDARLVPLRREFTIKQHQWLAQRFMVAKEATTHHGMQGTILTAYMGTGKTLMGLLLAAIQPRGATPTLILCPKSAIFEWATSGVEKFFDESSKSCLIYHPDILRKRRFHSITIDEMCSYDYVVTTYETVSVAATKAGDLACGSSRSRAGIGIPDPIAGRAVDERVVGSLLLYSIQWHRILADEGHLFCNPKTARYRNVMNLRAPRRHVLTGTPFKNCSVDLWALLRFIGFTGVDSATRWEKEGLAVYGALGIDSNVLSIDLSQCPDITLPPCVSKTVVVTLSELERQVYYRLLLAAVQRADDTPTDTMNILAAIVRMRQAAISPHVFVCVDEGQTDPSEDDDGGEINKEAPDANKSGGGQCGDARKSRRKKAAAAEKAPMSLEEKMGRASSILSSRSLGEGLDGGSSDNDALVRWVVDRTGTAGHRSSKIRAARTIIADHADEKVVVFCNSLSSLVLLVEAVNSEADPQHKVACYISGAHNATKRNRIITKWKTDPTMRVLCMTYATGSVALNLTESHICIFLDPGWNRVGWDQGGCRVHRIGQTHSVTLYNIVVKDSVEQFLIDMCRYKGDLGNLFFAPANESEDELEARLANIKDRLRIGDVINLLRRAYGIAKLEQQQAALGGAAIYSATAPTSTSTSRLPHYFPTPTP